MLVYLSHLCSEQEKVQLTEKNIDEGRPSRSVGQPLWVNKMPNGKYLLIDGHHRVVQAIRDERLMITAQELNPPMTALDYWADATTPVNDLMR